jgi:hypothetical protein
MIYPESDNTAADDPAIGWTMVNRLGQKGFRSTLDDVLQQPEQYQIVPEGGSPLGGSRQWIASAHPETLTGGEGDSYHLVPFKPALLEKSY